MIDIAGATSFIQLAQADRSPLLDLPAGGLTPDARLAALAYFERAGVAAADWLQQLHDPEFAFRVRPGKNTGRAARMAGELFQVVYRAGKDPRL